MMPFVTNNTCHLMITVSRRLNPGLFVEATSLIST